MLATLKISGSLIKVVAILRKLLPGARVQGSPTGAEYSTSPRSDHTPASLRKIPCFRVSRHRAGKFAVPSQMHVPHERGTLDLSSRPSIPGIGWPTIRELTSGDRSVSDLVKFRGGVESGAEKFGLTSRAANSPTNRLCVQSARPSASTGSSSRIELHHQSSTYLGSVLAPMHAKPFTCFAHRLTTVHSRVYMK